MNEPKCHDEIDNETAENFGKFLVAGKPIVTKYIRQKNLEKWVSAD